MTPENANALRQSFPETAIGKLPKGGVQLSYVGHAAVTDRLLAVDPCWNYEIVSLDDSGNPLPRGFWIKLTVCGVTRYGVGDGNSVKECIGDAIRNAAMRFGVALDLWSREELEQAGGPVQQMTAPKEQNFAAKDADPLNPRSALAKSMFAKLNGHGLSPEASKQYMSDVLGRIITSSKELTNAEAQAVIDALRKDAA